MSAETELALLRLPHHVRARIREHVRELAELVATVPASYAVVGDRLLRTMVAGQTIEYEIEEAERRLTVRRILSSATSAA